ncbi:proton-dependent oligopeptide transporter, POT family [Capnocytophaga haemolytica]|jgi:amino acid/peptide transporter|uniref:Amino acid permease n=1 Tax=Capnocytophaga haemolytica TaxID=45243 RepID=A0AAX2GXD2_9FLAO|nr:peptide MFS transporter [Capnocytophaga haemolytica]AMD84878.1 amino acid permease [Capnocytophaga haemolytica]SFN77037.1 proton-dependent oligopeptide transporter, POT family [Capnocytophaga haemolytica]SNV06700.1 Probable dipeptide and tripeptide permease YjdL [Capnocytophaga haemolytica]
MYHTNTKVLGQPVGLFFLFFTEMWERFSFYGMRALLVLFLTASLTDANPGWGWDTARATSLYGTYAMLIYLTPVLGGMIADRWLGARKTIIIGTVFLAAGQFFLFMPSHLSFYIGLACLVVGVGLFKPNTPTILSQLYKDNPEKKDSAYTIFYMGVNCGAFFGMMLCGYVGTNFDWNYGFGLAGVFMTLGGMLQFYFNKNLLGDLGTAPAKVDHTEVKDTPHEKRNPFTTFDLILTVLVVIFGLGYTINEQLVNAGSTDFFAFLDTSALKGDLLVIILVGIMFVYLLISRTMRYEAEVRSKMFGVFFIALFVIFFYVGFEQAPSSLTIITRDHVNRVLTGNGLLIFNIVNSLLVIVPLCIITYVLYKIAQVTWKIIPLTNLFIGICFVLLWVGCVYMLYQKFNETVGEIEVTWFQTLNSFFVITLASSVAKIWESKYNPPVAFKYAFGLLFVALGFLAIWAGSVYFKVDGKIPMLFLAVIYLLHTLGELFVSPVGLSYISKLVPVRMLAFMFGMWYLAIALAQKGAAALGGQVDVIIKNYGLDSFFLLFAGIMTGAAVVVMAMHPLLKRLMGEVK